VTFPLQYCPDGWQRLERLRELYEQRPQDRIYARMELPTEALRQFGKRHPDGPTDYPDLNKRVAFWDAFFAERLAVRDDSVPAAYLSELDQGLYGGMVGVRCDSWPTPRMALSRPWFHLFSRTSLIS